MIRKALSRYFSSSSTYLKYNSFKRLSVQERLASDGILFKQINPSFFPKSNVMLTASMDKERHSLNYTKIEQERKANLGKILELLKELVPNILVKALPKEIISKDIMLRICPTHFEELNAYIPVLKGHVSYYATSKALQLILTSVVLNPKVKLHIQSVRVCPPSDEAHQEFYGVYPNSAKIIIKWSSCPEGCSHLSISEPDEEEEKIANHLSTSDAKLGTHSWSKVDTNKLFNSGKKAKGAGKGPSITATLEHLVNSLIGLTREGGKLERTISGIFIFELNENNDKIIVHTIENIEVIEKRDPQNANSQLRVC